MTDRARDVIEAPAATDAESDVETPFQRFRADFFESRIAMAAFAVLVSIIFIAVAAPWISPQNPYDLAQVSVLDSSCRRASRA